MIWVWIGLAGCHGDADYDEDGFEEPADCDDGDPNAYPGAEEAAYDGVDQDCDGSDLVDRDADGFQAVEAGGPDCNDFDADVFPGAVEVPYDGTDQDCDDWSDDDFDHDGFEAMGHGGDDCDDTDARILPIDLDGDGYTSCTGDCDEGDPNRNEQALPICGNGFDDDCDDVSDCTAIGVIPVGTLPIRLAGTLDTLAFGTRITTPGDLDGDGVGDVIVTGQRPDQSHVAWFLAMPLVDGTDETAAWGALTSPDELIPSPIGDVDGDGRADLAVAAPISVAGPSRVWVVTELAPGLRDVAAGAALEVAGTAGDGIGEGLAAVGDRLAIGATGPESVQVLATSVSGAVAYGSDGAVITGPSGERFGAALHGFDEDGDGAADLMISGTGGPFSFSAGVYLVHDPPSSGIVEVDDLAPGRLDTKVWGQSNAVLTSGDLDADGTADAVIALPFANGAVGAVAVLLDGFDAELDVADEPVLRLGLGNETFGWSVAARDFDGDGFDDLVAGAPAAWAGDIGGPDKPGAAHLWYGPIAETVDFSFTADLLLEGEIGGYRSFTGYAVALEDVDGDGGMDLLVSSPLFQAGVVDVLPGGLTGLYGF